MRRGAVALALVAGCVDPVPPCTDGVCGLPPELADDGTTRPGTGDHDDGGSEAGTFTGTGETTAAPGPVCGDGTVEGEETCDDGDLVDGDGCNADCQPSLRILDQTTFDGGAVDRDIGRDVGIDGDGNVVVVGTARLGGVDTGFVLGLDPDFAERFVDFAVAMTGESSHARAVAVNPAGFAAVAGNLGAGDLSNALLLFYDPAGMRSWEATFDGPDALDDVAHDILFDPFGQLYAIGLSARASGGTAVLLLQYTADGLEIGDTALDSPMGVDVVPRGMAYAQTSTLVFAGVEVEAGIDEIIVSTIDLDPFGIGQSVRAGDPFRGAEASAVVVDGAGDVIVVGRDAGQGWAAKYTSALATVWIQPLDDSLQLHDVLTVPGDDSIYVVGDATGQGGANDLLVAHLDPAGTELARATHDLDGLHDSGRGIARAPDGTLVLTGETEGLTGYDAFVVRVAP